MSDTITKAALKLAKTNPEFRQALKTELRRQASDARTLEKLSDEASLITKRILDLHQTLFDAIRKGQPEVPTVASKFVDLVTRETPKVRKILDAALAVPDRKVPLPTGASSSGAEKYRIEKAHPRAWQAIAKNVEKIENALSGLANWKLAPPELAPLWKLWKRRTGGSYSKVVNWRSEKQAMNKQAGYNLVNEMDKMMVTFMKHFAKDLLEAGFDVTVSRLTASVKMAPGAAVVFELDPHNLPVGIRYRGMGIRIKAGEIAAYESSTSAKRAIKVLNSITV